MTLATTSRALAAAALLSASSALAQAPATAVPTIKGQAASLAKVTIAPPVGNGDSAVTSAPGTLVDQVVAIVNGDLILESDINADHRFEAFQPVGSPEAPDSRDAEVERLVNRQLILEQSKLQPDSAATPAEIDAQIATLRKEIPACKQYDCATDSGWARFVQAHGFTLQQVRDRVAQQLTILKFIELRFRTGIRIPQADITDYYKTKLLPEYARLHATAPKLDVLSDRIQGILLEQQVSSLLSDWLTSLKAQGSVTIMRPGEVQP